MTESIDHKRVEALLFPIAAFLNTAGLRKDDAQRIFSAAYDRKSQLKRVRRIEHIRHSGHYENIVAKWMRDKRFVDSAGRPRILAIDGSRSFSTLARSVNAKLDPRAVISIFRRYRTVRRVKKGMYELVTPYFATSTPSSTAFEPFAHFLSEASATLGRMLTPARSRKVESFWRMVDNTNMSEAAAQKFTIFIRERSQTFLEEIDEWLEANSQRGSRKLTTQRRRRVGLGLFSIYSNFKDWRQP